MTDKYVIELTETQYKALDEQARQHGYLDVSEYVLALAQGVADEPTKEEILAGLREGWHDAMTGNTHPASVLWDDEFWETSDDQ